MKQLTCPMPGNTSPLQPNNFAFSVHKIPEITFFLQDVNLPELSLGSASLSTPLVDVPIPGDKIQFGSLTATFIVDSRFKNYSAVRSWLIGLGYPENHDDFVKFIGKQASELSEHYKTVSDATLGILDGSNQAIATATFVDCFPISLSDIQFTTQATSIEPVKATVTFLYSHYQLNTVYD